MDYSMIPPEADDLYRSSGESSEEFNMNSAGALRKNLTKTFDQQVTRPATMRTSGASSVSGRIAQFEVAATAANAATRPPLPNQGNNAVPSNRLAVFLRIRPPALASDTTQKVPSSSTIEVIKTGKPSERPTTVRTYPPVDSNKYKINMHRADKDPCAKEFAFHQVLEPSSTQKTVYSTVAAPLIDGLWKSIVSKSNKSTSSQGESALLFAYGITNAGKTHTILGDVKSTNDVKWGVIPRAISDLFDRMNRVPKISAFQYDLYISYFEIYNEQIYDLVPKKSAKVFGPPPALKVRELAGHTIVRGLAKHKLRDVKHAIELTAHANSKRHTSSNNINAGSSRSHCICQLQLIQRSSQIALAQRGEDDSVVSMSGYSTDEELSTMSKNKSSTFWVVDLAGSERSKRTGVGSARQKEASQINKSLMTLMRCLTVMRESGRQCSTNVVPYRESKLSHVFMSHLAGPSAARTAMIVNANPSVADFDETQHVLSYASHAKMIQINSDELQKKRKMHFGTQYGMDGHKKVKTATSATTNLLSKVAKKLTPKKMANRLFRQRAGSTPSKTGRDAKPTQPTSHDGAQQEENRKLRHELEKAQAEVKALKLSKGALEEELSVQESKIRMEVSGEMKDLLRATRERSKEELAKLQAQLTSTLDSRCTQLAQKDRTEILIRELKDKVEVCEEEMLRMRTSHSLHVKQLQEEHDQEVATLQAQIKEGTIATHCSKDDTKKSIAKIQKLQKELQASQESNERLKKSKAELVDSYEKMITDLNEDEGSADKEDTENIAPGWKQRLLRPRRATNTPRKTTPKKTPKKSPLRRPLRSVTNNSAGAPTPEKSGTEQWVFPSKPPTKNESGTYRRPMGRAPYGREWDSGTGAWKLTPV